MRSNAILYRRIQGSIRSLVASILAEDDSESSVAFRGKILDALDDLDDPEVAPTVLKSYDNLTASLKPRAIDLLTRRPAWAKALLAAVAEKRVPATALNVTQLRKLQQSKDPEIARRVKAIWGTIREGRNPRRELVVNQIRRSLRRMTGDPAAGQAVFNKLCVQCHKIYGSGPGRRPRHHLERPQRLQPAPVQRLRPEPGHRPGLPGDDDRHPPTAACSPACWPKTARTASS